MGNPHKTQMSLPGVIDLYRTPVPSLVQAVTDLVEQVSDLRTQIDELKARQPLLPGMPASKPHPTHHGPLNRDWQDPCRFVKLLVAAVEEIERRDERASHTLVAVQLGSVYKTLHRALEWHGLQHYPWPPTAEEWAPRIRARRAA